jgi:hypothetical protein
MMGSRELKKTRKLNRRAWELCKKNDPQAFHLAKGTQTLLSTCADATPSDEFEYLKTRTDCRDMLSQPQEALPIGLKANLWAEAISDTYLVGSIQSWLGRDYGHIDDLLTWMEDYLHPRLLIQTEHHPYPEISFLMV